MYLYLQIPFTSNIQCLLKKDLPLSHAYLQNTEQNSCFHFLSSTGSFRINVPCIHNWMNVLLSVSFLTYHILSCLLSSYNALFKARTRFFSCVQDVYYTSGIARAVTAFLQSQKLALSNWDVTAD